MIVTLNKIKRYYPPLKLWSALLLATGKPEGDDEEIDALFILEHLGAYATVWCLRAVEGSSSCLRDFWLLYVSKNIHLVKDKRVLRAFGEAKLVSLGTLVEVSEGASLGVLDAIWEELYRIHSTNMYREDDFWLLETYYMAFLVTNPSYDNKFEPFRASIRLEIEEVKQWFREPLMDKISDKIKLEDVYLKKSLEAFILGHFKETK